MAEQRGSSVAFSRGLPVILIGGALIHAAASPVIARGTAAGTQISSVATASFHDNGQPVTVTSNAVSLRVHEILDVAVQPGSAERLKVMAGDAAKPLPFVVTNIGNGVERFALDKRTDLGDDKFDPSCSRLVLDANANNIFDASTDIGYIAGSNDPELQPDQSITVFAICDVPASGLAGDDFGSVRLDARAKTGTGKPGTIFISPDGDGIDALVGATTAAANALGGLTIGFDPPSIAKSQSIESASGGVGPIAGALVTYTLTAAIPTGNVANAIVADSVPAGTRYEVGSLRLDGTPLTDAADGDAGEGGAQGIEVRLGELTAAAPRVVSFKVRINQQ